MVIDSYRLYRWLRNVGMFVHFIFLTGTLCDSWWLPSQLDQEWYCAAKFWSGNQHVLISCCNYLQFLVEFLGFAGSGTFLKQSVNLGKIDDSHLSTGTGQIHLCNTGNVSKKAWCHASFGYCFCFEKHFMPRSSHVFRDKSMVYNIQASLRLPEETLVGFVLRFPPPFHANSTFKSRNP